jgi:hypothetical protein
MRQRPGVDDQDGVGRIAVAVHSPPLSRRRRLAVWLLIVFASLIAFVSTLTLWVDRQILDNNGWTSASEQVIADPQVQEALSVFVVNQLYQNVDVAASLQERLPSNLDPLAAPVAAGLRQPAANAFRFMLTQQRVQDLWVTASSRAHQRLVNVLENKTGAGISTGNGDVTLQLGPLVQRLAGELGLSQGAASKLPPDAGTITLLRSSQLNAAQLGVHAVRVLSKWLLVLVIAMYTAAAFIARGERRVTIRTIGWSLVLVGLGITVVRKVAGNYVIDALASPAYRGTGHRVWLIATSILAEIGTASILYGALLVCAMFIAGDTRPARAVRRVIAPVAVDQPMIPWLVAGSFLLLLVLWGGTHALRTWWGVALFAILIAGGVIALQRQLRAELEAQQVPPPEGPTIADDQLARAKGLAVR